jgi:hypothetical protein
VSKSATLRHFVALGLGTDILMVQIDGILIIDNLGAGGSDWDRWRGRREAPARADRGCNRGHRLVQALNDDLIERGLETAVPRLFTRSLSRSAIQPCQIYIRAYRPAETYMPSPERCGCASRTTRQQQQHKMRMIPASAGFDFLGVHLREQQTPRGW